jgi:hypothetical protein
MGLREYKTGAKQWVTLLDTEFFPDYLGNARQLYVHYIDLFQELVKQSESSIDLFLRINELKGKERIQLLRVFRKYVSPNTAVEMTKKKKDAEGIIEAFGASFRTLDEVRESLSLRPGTDEALVSILYEYKDRGQKGYDLTTSFFEWFDYKYGDEFSIVGPVRAGRDVMLNEVLPNYIYQTPADFLIRRRDDNMPLVVGFARYDSDRGGAQADDRTGGNRDKITEIRSYARRENLPLKLLFLNDGPGLTIGEMWETYCQLEDHGQDYAMVCTLKMLDERLTKIWMEKV